MKVRAAVLAIALLAGAARAAAAQTATEGAAKIDAGQVGATPQRAVDTAQIAPETRIITATVQIAPATAKAGAPAQLAPAARTAKAPPALSGVSDGRNVRLDAVGGRDRCDPANRTPADRAECERLALAARALIPEEAPPPAVDTEAKAASLVDSIVSGGTGTVVPLPPPK